MSEPEVRRLVVVRHAQAEQHAGTDSERALTREGRDASRDVGAWLVRRGVRPDGALVSTATRTRETWAAICEGGGYDESVAAFERGLYSGGPESALDLVRLTDPAVRTLVLIGHNPTIGWLALGLDDGSTEVLGQAATGYPAAAVTVFELPGEWADLDEQGGRAVAYHVGGR